MKKRLSTFIPDLKAANDSLPSDPASLDIENVDVNGQYIEMDLGLGVLEELREGEDESEDSEEDASSRVAVMEKLLNQPTAKRPSFLEVVYVKPEAQSILFCDDNLAHYRDGCPLARRPELAITLSLMSRILRLLRRHRSSTNLKTITSLNVLQEDMYKLMARRDRILDSSDNDLPPTHETLYFDELDKLLEQ